MLTEIKCDQFRQKVVNFSNGLNVILGDADASNSIGKSSLLMVIDFAFGGDTFINYNTDVPEELGHHDYFFKFVFEDEEFIFRRGTETHKVIYKCSDDYAVTDHMTLDEYRAFLKSSYGLAKESLSFRAMVGLHSRVWGKENLTVDKPLHNFHSQKASDCILNLIKTYGRYQAIEQLQERQRTLQTERDALRNAFRQNIVPKINKTAYKTNSDKIEKIETELEEIKEFLKIYATNIKEVANHEVFELKVRKDGLLDLKLSLESRLSRISRNIAENRHVKSRHFEPLKNFFPEVDDDRIAHIEEFHNGLTKVLKSELLEAELQLKDQIQELDVELKEMDTKIGGLLENIENPNHIVDRVYNISNELTSAKGENSFYDQDTKLKTDIDTLKTELSDEKEKILDFIQDLVNDSMSRISSSVFGPDRRSPNLDVSEKNYEFHVEEDTGTGKAYSSLIIFDLAVFMTTNLPFLIHDSVCFKNIENNSVSKLVKQYLVFRKQSFISIDEISKYGTETSDELVSNAVIELTDTDTLYIKDWRQSTT